MEYWLRKAAKFYEYAREDFRSGRYDSAAFFAQQSVELAFKALLIRYTGARPQTHSLSALLEMLEKALGVAFSGEIRRCAESLESHYIQARYPDARLNDYRSWEAEEAIKCMEVLWRHVVDPHS